MRVLRYGDTAVLVECRSFAEAQGWFAALQGRVEEAVLGAQSVLLRGNPDALCALVKQSTPVEADPDERTTTIDIPVQYDGPDLAGVATSTGLTQTEVVKFHTAMAWTVAFGGFAPGFCYLVGGDHRLEVPRRNSPRPSIPAGSVGLADRFSGVYPSDSPGGWQIIGHTDVLLWDLERDPPALLTPGQTVRFVEIR